MQKEFKDQCAVVGKVLFKSSDLLESLLPESLVNFLNGINPGNILVQYELRVYPCHQHILIMRSVMNRYFTTGRQRQFVPPEIIMIQLIGGRCLEAIDFYTKRIEARHDVLYRSILPCCIHCLK